MARAAWGEFTNNQTRFDGERLAHNPTTPLDHIMRRYTTQQQEFPPEAPSPPDASDWVIYFAAKDIEFRRLSLRKGEIFPWQHKPTIRDYLRGLCPNIDQKSFAEIPWLIQALRVPPRLYREIIDAKLRYPDALALVRRYKGH
jgi:hypothetical protein